VTMPYEHGPTPDVEEVLQREPYEMAAIPVKLEGPTDIRVMPSKRGRWDSLTIVAGQPRLLLDYDPRIRLYRLLPSLPTGSTATGIILGTENQIKAPNGPFGFIMPPAASLIVEGCESETWVTALGAAGQLVIVSVRAEFWCD
jgi:hypothetical protein